MKEIKTFFERAAALDHIEVTVRAAERDAEVEALLSRVSGAPRETLTVTGTDGTVFNIATDGIISVSVMGKDARIVTADNCYTVRSPLQTLEGRLPGEDFIRSSRYEIVNLRKVLKYDFTLVGTLRLEFEGGMETWASRRCIPAIRERLNGKG